MKRIDLVAGGKPRRRLAVMAALATLTLAATSSLHAQGVPALEWTDQERQFVTEMRELYLKQGMDLSTQQAEAAVKQYRERQQPATVGVPPEQWTAKEAQLIAQMRAQYQKQGMPFTDEQAAMAVKSMREQIAKVTGNVAAFQAMAQSRGQFVPSAVDPAPAPAPTSATMTEAALAEQLAQLPPHDANLVITQRREGFTVNGQPVIDPAGRIRMYGFDVVTGDITFAVATPSSTVIKVMRAGANVGPLVIAHASQTRNGWTVRTVTGQEIFGDTLSMMPRGVLVSRPGAVFRYDPGIGVKSIAIPEGYTVAPMQRGQVGGTGYLLLRKDEPAGSNNRFSQLVGSVKAIGAAVGVGDKQDYALFSAETGKTLPLSVSVEGENVTKFSNCRKRNLAINECENSETFESLYEPNGRRNINHYYWRAHWLNTPTGPIAVTMENGARDIFIHDLTTGKRVQAFHRTLGIADMEVTQQPDGTVTIDAQLAFKKRQIADAVAYLANTPEGAEAADEG